MKDNYSLGCPNLVWSILLAVVPPAANLNTTRLSTPSESKLIVSTDLAELLLMLILFTRYIDNLRLREKAGNL